MVVSNIRSASKFKQTVLIIDDQPTVLAIHAAIIRSLKLSLNIVTMTNPIEALTWMSKREVDLIVTDFRMMNMNGMEFVETINRTNSAGPKPIIVISVLKDKKLHKELVAAGASACLTKPVNATSLANMAYFLLDRSKQFYNYHHLETQ